MINYIMKKISTSLKYNRLNKSKKINIKIRRNIE